MAKKILITGGAGFIGSNLVRYLIRETEHQVLNLDALTYAGNLDSLADVADDPRYQWVQTDICDGAAVAVAFHSFQPDWVLHLAAESHVDRSIDGPGAFIQTNIVGTYHLLQASLQYWRSLPAGEWGGEAKNRPTGSPSHLQIFPPSHLPTQVSGFKSQPSKESFRFLHVSTDEVYGSLEAEGLFSETTPYDPHSPYAASKAASDHLVRAWGTTYGLPVIVTNCSNNYGPYQFPEKLIPLVILKALRGENIPVYGRGENIRDWLYVGDHVEALHTVIAKGRVGATYNIGGHNELKNIDLVHRLCALLDELKPRPDGRPYAEQITFVPDRPGHDLRYAIDASKIRDELGWQPRQDAHTGFRKTVLWYLENPQWTEALLHRDDPLKRLGQSPKIQS